ncbi:septum formation family protein [Antrihabitans sp. YC2-6]|uniref:septum formation family protein n=1 Tax=Antrihabitans sp. YC2-6 TaxID=2799498 RepID=UPI0018F30A99|nr:septum formation family protein [Antrihabitans sp. YC2-6]
MSAATTRRVLAAVAIGAIVAAIATIFIAGGFKKDNDLAVTPPGESAGRAEGQTFLGASSGSCFTWTNDGADIGEIDCAEPHKFEVAAVIDLSQYPGTEFAPGSTYPDVLRFTELQQEHCDGAVNDYMRMKFDPNGKYEVGSINPGQDGWNAGERTLLCGIKLVKPSGVFMPMGGPVLGQDQSKIWDTGTCFGISQSQATDMVDCKQPHAFEVAGFVDLSTQFPGGPPSEEDQQKFLNEACGKVVDDYLGSPDALRNKTLTAFAGEPLNAMSWLSGSRKVNCHVGKSNADGFAPIVGSAKGDILIDGQAPVPPPPEPEGRALPTPLPGAAPLPQPPG